jgi:predicted anti-sigma-YlaC factor YlaD
MTCHDVRKFADSFLSQKLLTETNHGILRHLDKCPSCRADIDGRKRIWTAARSQSRRCVLPDTSHARRRPIPRRHRGARRSGHISCARLGDHSGRKPSWADTWPSVSVGPRCSANWSPGCFLEASI